jgi:regulator of sigma E protease
MNDVGFILIGILGLAVLMVVHEAGHYFAARAFGMRVTKFSIGFGPAFFRIVPKDGYFWFATAMDRVRIRLWKHDPEKHGPTIYQVAMIPFLAYVHIAGMNPIDEIDPKDKGSYANASVFARIVAIFGGPLSNYLFASVFFFFAFLFGGKAAIIHVNNEPQLATYVDVLPGRPAEAAGLRSGDKIVEVGGTPVGSWDEMAKQISERPGKQTTIVVERNSQRVPLEVTPSDEKGSGKIGVSAHKLEVPVREAALLAVTEPAKVVKNLVIGLGQLVTFKAEGELGGPLRIVKETAQAARMGGAELMRLLGGLSAYLGAFNLIPFPALDGGRLVFLGYEAATRRRANREIESYIHAIGLVALLALVLWVTIFKDIGFGAK